MKTTNNNTTDRELHIARELNAHVELVWEVWTNPLHIAKWWGPAGFTNTIRKMDVEPDGEWLLTMHGPDGKNFPNKSIFKEIVPNEKIVFEHFNPNYWPLLFLYQKKIKHFCNGRWYLKPLKCLIL